MTATLAIDSTPTAPPSRLVAHFKKYEALIRGLVIRRRYRDYTMIPPFTFAANLEICATLAPERGCIVECGVWRGGMSAGVADVLPARVHYLFDSFEGLPPAQEIDGDAARKWQSEANVPGYYDNCRADASYAARAMTMSRASKFTLVSGWFRDTLPNFVPSEGIAVLRLDADWYESTTECLNSLYNYVVPRGLIIIDDYYTWDGCTRAVHDFLSHQKRPDRIRSSRGVCFIVKDKR